MTALGVDPHDPARIWVGTAAGGVFLTEDEQRALRDVAALGALVTAQDVPAARAVPLEEMLTNGEASS